MKMPMPVSKEIVAAMHSIDAVVWQIEKEIQPMYERAGAIDELPQEYKTYAFHLNRQFGMRRFNVSWCKKSLRVYKTRLLTFWYFGCIIDAYAEKQIK